MAKHYLGGHTLLRVYGAEGGLGRPSRRKPTVGAKLAHDPDDQRLIKAADVPEGFASSRKRARALVAQLRAVEAKIRRLEEELAKTQRVKSELAHRLSALKGTS